METEMSGSGKEGVTMQKHIERPVHLSKTHRADERKQEVWPLSAREFMKLPVSGLMSAGKRLTFTRFAPSDQAA